MKFKHLLCFKNLALVTAAGLVALPMATRADEQAGLPDAIKVPAGHKVMMETVGKGEISYECRVKKDAMNQYEWTFVGPDARLSNRQGQAVGRYYGPPATWEAIDGSRVTATQVAVAPGAPGSLPLQLVKANPATGSGILQGVAYIQRVATQAGLAPAAPCAQAEVGQKQNVSYQADYIFWQVQ